MHEHLKGCNYHFSFLAFAFRIESVKLRITDSKTEDGMIASASQDGFIKYWKLKTVRNFLSCFSKSASQNSNPTEIEILSM